MEKHLLHPIGHFIALILLSFTPAEAQEKIKFGKIPLEDLEMTQYEFDTTAHAVVLYDNGHLDGVTNVFTRHTRLKVLRSAGASYANFQLRTTSKSSISGSTYNLVDGKIAETRLAKENVFKEEIVEGYYTYKVFFPGVKPGSVVELKYSFVGLPFEWRFQERIPVRYNELVLEPTQYIVFKKTMFGNHPVEVDGYKWVASNVPAFLEEPYMSHYSNYLTHFKMDIESILGSIFRSNVNLYMDFSSSWEKIGERLMDATYFGRVLNNSPFLNDKAREIRNSTFSTRDKVKMAFDHIQENIKWNGWATEFASDQLWTNFKKNHSGNSAEVNLLLIALLQKIGIKTYPAVLSTRDNGLLNPVSASLTGLNYVVAYVKTDSLELLLDATEPDLVPGMLPTRCRNISAYVIDEPGGWWLDLSAGKANTYKQFIVVEPDGGGNLIATVTNTHEDYAYLEWIKEFKDKGSEDAYIRSVVTKTTDLSINDCKLTIEKDKMRASEIRTVDLTNSEYVHDLGNELLINPFLFSDISNPFKREERRYPIDFISPRNRSVIISFKIPDNYTLRRVPEAVSFSPEFGGAHFSFMSSLNNNVLTIVCRLRIEKQIFSQEEYAPLRQFFIEINRKISEPIQIDKKT